MGFQGLCKRSVAISGFCEWKTIPGSYLKTTSFPGGSAGEESTCNAGDPGLIPGSGRSSGEGIGYPLQCSWASLVAQTGKESACNVGDLGLIPGLGRSPGEGKGYPLRWESSYKALKGNSTIF